MSTLTEHTDTALWVCLSQIKGLGGQTFCKLLKHFGSPEQIYAASYTTLRDISNDAIASQISAGPDLQQAQATLSWLEHEHNHILTLADSLYPKTLLEIADPPPILYAKGELSCLQSPALAIVGSRYASPLGIKTAKEFAQALTEHGLCIVSGLALGIDGAAHEGALLGTGNTIAVVGTGLDIVYPAKHRELAHQIAKRGLILSELALGTPSIATNFPRRNRLISGLSLGCLVVEANLQSGSLITAALAAEQGREVFAIPGSIHSPVAKGCHQLIKQGAKLVDHTQDILEELNYALANFALPHTDRAQPDGAAMTSVELSSEQNTLLKNMGHDPINFDTLLNTSGLTSDRLSAMLSVLELEGKIASLPGGRYQQIA